MTTATAPQNIADYGRLVWSKDNQGWAGPFRPDESPWFFVFPRQNAPEGRRWDLVDFPHIVIKHLPTTGNNIASDVEFEVAVWMRDGQIMVKGKGSRKFGEYIRSMVAAIEEMQPGFLPEVA
jgi:hypothetical protein